MRNINITRMKHTGYVLSREQGIKPARDCPARRELKCFITGELCEYTDMRNCRNYRTYLAGRRKEWLKTLGQV